MILFKSNKNSFQKFIGSTEYSFTKLDLQFKDNNIGNEQALELGQTLAKYTQIEKLILNLVSNYIEPKGALQLGTGLANLKNLLFLEVYLQLKICARIATVLYILVKNIFNRSNNIRSNGATALGLKLKQCLNLKNLQLVLNFNNIGTDGVNNLVFHIAQCKKIQYLTLIVSQNLYEDSNTYKIKKQIFKMDQLVNFYLEIDQKENDEIEDLTEQQQIEETEKVLDDFMEQEEGDIDLGDSDYDQCMDEGEYDGKDTNFQQDEDKDIQVNDQIQE
ncbi:hypothetical protein ABPG74_006743 [Tetrahymena malaccensis]